MKTITLSVECFDGDEKQVVQSLYQWYEEHPCGLHSLEIVEQGQKVNLAGCKDAYNRQFRK